MKRKGKIKTAITILAVLLGIALLLLIGTLIYDRFVERGPSSVTVPDNIISPEESGTSQTASDGDGSAAAAGSDTLSIEEEERNSEGDVTAEALTLHARNPGDNLPFSVGNMFPGDRETKYYCLRVSHHEDVTLRFRADVRPGYEKLAEVLKCRVVLPESGKVLYEGLMRDMPESVNVPLAVAQSGGMSEVYYEVTVSLDTSVGNEYMNLDLIADFRWWVEETGGLLPPQTADTLRGYCLIFFAAGSLLLLILFGKKRRKEGAVNG